MDNGMSRDMLKIPSKTSRLLLGDFGVDIIKQYSTEPPNKLSPANIAVLLCMFTCMVLTNVGFLRTFGPN